MRYTTISLLLAVSALMAADLPRPAIPVEKNIERHKLYLEVAKAGGIDLLFLGDSITDHWRTRGKNIWDKYFAPLKAANFGIGGDRTEHVIWRVRNGELAGIHPKLVVLMIGTNNTDPVDEVAIGIKTIIEDIQQRLPGTRILLLGKFPRGELPNTARQRNDAINIIIEKCANPNDPKRVIYMDIGKKFLTPEGVLSKDIMSDFAHPDEKGYQIWAEAIIDVVKQQLKDDFSHLTPTFVSPSTSPKVAKIEAAIAAGGIVAGAKALEKLSLDKDADTAEAAKTSLAIVTAWKASIDAELSRLQTIGDVCTAADLASALSKLYPGETGKNYKDQAADMRNEMTYAAGKDYHTLAKTPYEARKDPRFEKMVEAFLKNNPDGYYAEQARSLISK